MFTNPNIFASRLSDVEKIIIASASEDRLDYLFYNFYRFEFSLNEVESKCVFNRAAKHVKDNYYKKQADLGAQVA
jgi:hypothetical protein